MRVLILVPGDVGEKMSGPAIRAWLLAQGLSRGHSVTVAIDGRLPDSRPSGLRVVPATRSRLLFETPRHDAVVAACLPPFMMIAARAAGVVMVADHYDPVELELDAIGGLDRRLRSTRALRRLVHQHADLVVCASTAQRRMLLQDLDDLGRTGDSGPLVGIVPFGIPPAPERTSHTPLRERFPQIRESDRIVLWWGKIWSWFDAESAVRAFAPLASSRPDVKLVITAGPAPDASTEAYSVERQAFAVAQDLGLLDRTVFFLREWLPYEQRHHCLHEADLGLTLHADTPEAEFAARARYMDYLWAGLPCVLARGDEISEQFGAVGFARLVEPGGVPGVTRAVVELLAEPETLETARRAGAGLADRYRWTTISRELGQLIEEAVTARHKGAVSLRLTGGAGHYYARRLADKAVATASARRTGYSS